MNTNVYTHRVKITDIGPDFLVTNKAILNMLQETANSASSKVGFGVNNIEETGSTWVLLYWRLEMYDRVRYDSALNIKTWANFNKKIYSIRNFEIYHEDKVIGKAESKWVFVDAKNHGIKKITDEMVELYGNVEEPIFDTAFNDRVKFSEEAKKVYEYKTMRRDLDANHHVNNNVFIDIAIEALPEEIASTNFSNVSIIYKKELNYKDNVSCYYELKDNKHYIYLYNDTTDTFSSVITFE